LLAVSAAAYGQVNPHTQIRWPASCRTSDGKIYNWVTNDCVDLNDIDPNTQLTWPTSCNTPGAVYDATAGECPNNINSINVTNQVNYPASCATTGMVYDPATKQCTYSVNHINPGTQMLWPSSCTPGMVYNPSGNTCVAMGTGNNPGGTNLQMQYNNGGFFGGMNGVTYDNNGGIAATGTLAAGTMLQAPTIASGGAPTLDLRNKTFAGGLKADGATDNAAVMTAAWNALPATGGRLLIVCGGTLATACYWDNPAAFNWAGHTPVTFEIQGILRTGTTLNIPPNSGTINFIGKNGSGPIQFQAPGDISEIYVRPLTTPISGTLNTAIAPTYYGTGNPTATVPVACNSSTTGATYQDLNQANSVLWQCISTTGTITAGAMSTLVLASAAGYAKGDRITVAGAGTSGGTLTSIISAISGTSITLGTAATTAVSGAAVSMVGNYAGYSITPVNGWIQGILQTLTPSANGYIYGGSTNLTGNVAGTNGTVLGVADYQVCDLATVSRTTTRVTGTMPSTTGSITSGQSTLTIPAGITISNGSAITIIGAGVSTSPLRTYVLSGGGTTSLTIAGTAASTVTNQAVSENCHIPVNIGIKIAGVTDSSFNGQWGGTAGQWQIVNGDYVANTLVWSVPSGTTATSSGGTITGLNEDSPETVPVADNTSTTFTARFYRPHVSTAQFSGAGMELNAGGAGQLLKDLHIVASGPQLVVGNNSYKSVLDNIGLLASGTCSAFASQSLSGWAMDIQGAAFTYFKDGSIGSSCYPWSIHLYNAFNTIFGGTGPLYLDNTWMIDAIKLDHGATGAFLNKVVCEQCSRGIVTYDDSLGYWSGNQQQVEIKQSGFQDNPAGVTQCGVASLFPDSVSSITVQGSGITCIKNDYAGGTIMNIAPPNAGAQYDLNNTTGPAGIIQAKSLEAELRGVGASMAPSVLPYASQNIKTNPTTWPLATCTLASSTAEAPDGTATAASLNGPVGGSSVNVGPLIGLTPAVGDMILFGVWTYTPTKGKNATGTGAGAMTIENGASSHYFIGPPNGLVSITTGNNASTSPYDSQFVDDWWHVVVGVAEVLQSDGTAGQQMRVYLGCNSGVTLNYWEPFVIYVPASAGISQAEVMRWRQQLLHGFVPPNVAANYLYTSLPTRVPNYQGQVTLASGTATVNTAYVRSDSRIFYSHSNCVSCGVPYTVNITPGTSFQVQSTNAADGSIVWWEIR